jgi:hypothetical protein
VQIRATDPRRLPNRDRLSLAVDAVGTRRWAATLLVVLLVGAAAVQFDTNALVAQDVAWLAGLVASVTIAGLAWSLRSIGTAGHLAALVGVSAGALTFAAFALDLSGARDGAQILSGVGISAEAAWLLLVGWVARQSNVLPSQAAALALIAGAGIAIVVLAGLVPDVRASGAIAALGSVLGIAEYVFLFTLARRASQPTTSAT